MALAISQVNAALGDRIAVLCGDDALTVGMMACGARGVISVASNVLPGAVSAVCRAALAGDFAEARARFYLPRTYASYEELLRDETVEAVYIPLPNSEHRAWTIRAARHARLRETFSAERVATEILRLVEEIEPGVR